MNTIKYILFALAITFLTCIKAEAKPTPQLDKANTLFSERNYNDAFKLYKEILITNNTFIPKAMIGATDALQRLNRHSEIDTFLTMIITKYSRNWKCYQTAGEIYSSILMHSGYIQGGIFIRGRTRDYSSSISINEHDRLTALNYMDTATELIKKSSASNKQKSDLYYTTAKMYIKDIYSNTAIRLLLKSNIKSIPAYTTAIANSDLRGKGAPTTLQNEPYFFALPLQKDKAQNDGELFRWYLHQSSEYIGNSTRETATIAEFSERLYSVETISNEFYNNEDISEYIDQLYTLRTDQTISKLETGIQLFTLPNPYNFLGQYIDLIDKEGKTKYAARVAGIFENRRQYSRAAKYWKIVKDSTDSTDSEKIDATRHLTQIQSSFVKFENSQIQSTSAAPRLPLIFRNIDKVSIKAISIDTEKFLGDIITLLKNEEINLSDATRKIQELGLLLANGKEIEYLKNEVYNSSIDLSNKEPIIKHGEGRTDIVLPKKLAGGAYFIEAKLESGYTAYTILWLSDLTLISKSLINNDQLYFTSESSTGLSIADTELNVFGFNNRPTPRIDNIEKYFVEATLHTNKDGIAQLPKSIVRPDFHYLVTAKTKDNRKAYIGFEYLDNHYRDEPKKDNRILYITDKPLYRPGETIQISGWIRDYNYTDGQAYPPNHRKSVNISLYNPLNEKTESKNVLISDNGNFLVNFTNKQDAPLGVWTIRSDLEIEEGGNYFRIEEFKKPEYTVSITPNNPIPTITDDIAFTVSAEYNFGKPLQNAKVTYEAYSQPIATIFTPTTIWDWLYGPGYQSKTISSSSHSFRHTSIPPREEPTLLDNSVIFTDKAGKAIIKLSPPKFDKDTPAVEYLIKATISDESNNVTEEECRKTVSKTAFELLPETDQNFYYTGEEAQISFTPYTNSIAIDKNIASPAEISISKFSELTNDYTLLSIHSIKQSSDHIYTYTFAPHEEGKYLAKCKTTDNHGNLISNKIEFYVCSKGHSQNAKLTTDKSLEVIAKAKSYAPGDTAELLILSKQPTTTLLVFSGINSEAYTLPKIIQTNSQENIISYKVKPEDAPNTFIEVINSSEEQVHTATAELFIPPTTKILNLTVKPECSEYSPASTARLKLNLSNFDHTAFTGQGIIAVYDAALDEITGNSNAPSIEDFFWGFVNYHYPMTTSSLNKYSYNLCKDGVIQMQPIGIFGDFFKINYPIMPLLGRTQSFQRQKGQGVMFAANMQMDTVMKTESAIAPTPSMSSDNSSNIRKDFSTTAVFLSDLKFDNTGEIILDIPLPDTLTKWKIKLWAMTSKTEVAHAESSIVTSKELMLIPSLPRFLVEGDSTSIRTTIYNNYNKDKEITVKIKSSGGLIIKDKQPKSITVSANSQHQVFWNAYAEKPIDSSVVISVHSDVNSDSVAIPLSILKTGQQLFDSKTILLGSTDKKSVSSITLPKNIDKKSSSLKLTLYPDITSLLINTADNLQKDIPNTNDAAITKLIPRLIINSLIQSDHDRIIPTDSIYNTTLIKADFAKALTMLSTRQNTDGGWSWIGKSRHSSPYISSLILQNLEKADKHGIHISAPLITGARLYLIDYETEQLKLINEPQENNLYRKTSATNLDAMIYSTLAQGGNENIEMRDFLYKNRTDLSVYGLSLFATGLYFNDNKKLLDDVLNNIEQYLTVDKENHTAYLHLQNSNFWWYWYGSESETIANYLNLRILLNQDNFINEQLAHYLINNIKHISRNDSTQAVASAFSALQSFIMNSPKPKQIPKIAVSLNNILPKQSTPAENSKLPSVINIIFDSNKLNTGENKLKVEKIADTESSLYYSYTLSFYSLDEIVKPHGLELKTMRKFYRLVPKVNSLMIPDGRGSDKELSTISYTKEEIKQGDAIQKGDLIETELILTSKNDYEYIYLKDNKPATLEPINNKSGYSYNGVRYYTEYQNESVNYYIESLPRGSYSFKYRSYSLFSGTFSAKSSISHGVFAPELNSNSSGFMFKVRD